MKGLGLRNGRWQIRLGIPEDVRDVIGKREFVKSLGVLSKADAEIFAHQYIAQWKTDIAQARGRVDAGVHSLLTKPRSERVRILSELESDLKTEKPNYSETELVAYVTAVAVQSGIIEKVDETSKQAIAGALGIVCDPASHIVQLLRIKAMIYSHHTTGRYTTRRVPSVTLYFSDLASGEILRACFNAALTRQRTTKHGIKGESLPSGQFRIKDGSALLSLWRRVELTVPPRISTLYRHLGNLSSVILTGGANLHGKLENASLTGLTIDHSTIVSAWMEGAETPQKQSNMSHNTVTSKSQLSHNSVTETRHKKTDQPHVRQGLGKTITTRQDQCKERIKELRVTQSINTSSTSDIHSHTDDEWLADYDRELEDQNRHRR